MSDVAGRIARLSPDKQDVLWKWLKARGADVPGPNETATSIPLLIDPAARAALKRERPGLRRIGSDAPCTPLATDDPDGAPAIAIDRRRTCRQFAADPVPIAELGRLLACLRERHESGERRLWYPSAGGVYALHCYVHTKVGRISGAPAGAHWYDPERHQLVTLSADADIDAAVHDPFVNRPVFDRAAFSLFLIARMEPIQALYADHAATFAAIEAGCMTQLLMEQATATSLGLCPIGALDFERIRPTFALQPTDALIHSLVGGVAAAPPPSGSAGREVVEL